MTFDAKRRARQAILSVFFLDNLGLAIVYPIFTPLILRTTSPLLPSFTNLQERIFFLCFLIAAFPFAQCIGGPLLGHLADRQGRRHAFHVALLGEAVGFVLTGLSIQFMSYFFLIVSRLLTGFFAGSLTLCFSTLSDLSAGLQNRSTHFGIMASLFGLSFTIGAALGGILSNHILTQVFNSSLPFWIMACLSILNLLIIKKYLKKIYPIPSSDPFYHHLRRLKQIILQSPIGLFYLVFFFFMLGWIMSLQFLPSLVIEYFNGSKLIITILFISIGILWYLSNRFINPICLRLFPPPPTTCFALFILSLAMLCATFTSRFSIFSFCVLLGAVAAGIIWTNSLALISTRASAHFQGKLLGLNQAIMTLAMVIAPISAALLPDKTAQMIYLLASASLLISFLIKIFILKIKTK